MGALKRQKIAEKKSKVKPPSSGPGTRYRCPGLIDKEKMRSSFGCHAQAGLLLALHAMNGKARS